MIHALIYALLTGQDPNSQLAGNSLALAGSAVQSLNGLAQGRVYPLVAPQGVDTPYIVYSVPTEPVDATFCGRGPVNSNVQVDCYHEQLLMALAMRDAVEDALAPLGGVVQMRLEDRDDDTKTFRATVELSIWR